MAEHVLIAGATGFVGSSLAEALARAGYSVLAMTRHPDSYDGVGKPVFGDVDEPESLRSAMAGADAAYYLVHSLQQTTSSTGCTGRAQLRGSGCAAGLERIIYLGGLGRDDQDLSDHLRSRREVEKLLGGIPVTVVRAAIIIGHGGISWEITRQWSLTSRPWWCRSGRRPGLSRSR